MIYLFLTYTIVWLGVLGYALGVSRRSKLLAERVQALEVALAAAREGAAPAQAAGETTGRA